MKGLAIKPEGYLTGRGLLAKIETHQYHDGLMGLQFRRGEGMNMEMPDMPQGDGDNTPLSDEDVTL
jgi:hypothetical protein